MIYGDCVEQPCFRRMYSIVSSQIVNRTEVVAPLFRLFILGYVFLFLIETIFCITNLAFIMNCLLNFVDDQLLGLDMSCLGGSLFIYLFKFQKCQNLVNKNNSDLKHGRACKLVLAYWDFL